MPRVSHVVKARKDQGKCFNCGTAIKRGESYKHASLKTGPRSGTKRRWCAKCRPKPSQLTVSKMSGVYAAQESYEDEVGGITVPSTQDEAETAKSDLESALETCSEEIRGVAEEYQESAQNIEDGFGHSTYQSEELSEKAEELESWADDVGNVDLDDLPDDDDELEDWWNDQTSKAEEAVNECPV